MRWSCSGCSKTFERERDLGQHLTKTKAKSSSPPANGAPGPSHTVPNESEDEPPPVPFEGDFYGDDYNAQDFPGFGDDDANEDSEEEDDADEEEAVGLDALAGEDIHLEQPDPVDHAQPPLPERVSPVPSAVDPDVIMGDPPHNEGGRDAEDHHRAPAPGGVEAAAHDRLRSKSVHVDHFGGQAGAPLPSQTSPASASGYRAYGSNVGGSSDNPYAPFRSELDWRVAEWAKRRAPTSNAFSELLAIKGLIEALGLSYKNAKELNNVIDAKLPHHRPAFTRLEAEVMGEKFEMYSARNVLGCIISLYSDPEHARYLCLAPERHYADGDKTIRLYHDLHTGQWWWSVQRQLEADKAGATVIPVIISSDKTQVTLFRNKSAYPVYLTIGNLPKTILSKPRRQGQILLAYLPTNCTPWRSQHFHPCMRYLLAPLQSAGLDGILIASGDGLVRRCHPILAVYVGDYPEQCLVSRMYSGDCPVCESPHSSLGDNPSEPIAEGCEIATPDRFAEACAAERIKPVQHPFWEDLPNIDIFQSIASDVLHQLYQGVFKHLLDARVARLPPNHGIRIFYKGISSLSRVSGAEHRQISRFLLGVIIDMNLPGGRDASAQLVRATRALLDFLFMVQYPIHSAETLDALDSALSAFHDDKDIFITLGVRTGFNIPKLHSLQRYVRCIKLFGTTDKYNTETSERLHIDFTKDAYRATNHKDEYPQMTRWLERREKIAHHSNYVLWRIQQVAVGPRPLNAHHGIRWHAPDMTHALDIKMTRHPSRRAVPLAEVISLSHYGARFFTPALTRFIVQWRHPEWTSRQVEYHADDFILPFERLPVFHRIKFWNEAIYGKETVDSVHVHPRQTHDGASREIVTPARFDTVLVRVRGVPEEGSQTRTWTHGCSLNDVRVAQVRLVFSLPDAILDYLFPVAAGVQRPPRHLAYVEWFSKFSATPDPNSRMYRVVRTIQGGERVASVPPVGLIERSAHLIPKWTHNVPRNWTCENVLEQCGTFYVNPFQDGHIYFNLY
ncbi:uncharacterized protein TRAVEDRAFT_41080 [Trametes versicolor FP-101664 SS1]|uniref:C2H2-type domain-containing protein n=1 Tax=Trametes versicolor (strain FP-101664) TaxID=717944 RepID=R7S7B1_TRAVS|nr:uncharacterized protein TRAVEDRAFT_41080 [Trametes versicolor FP-101664 SS1]EIW51487.1 hypothetical protein TRAVEDRAFT_41080 [Trametes versicolor FP-101664 SS1]